MQRHHPTLVAQRSASHALVDVADTGQDHAAQPVYLSTIDVACQTANLKHLCKACFCPSHETFTLAIALPLYSVVHNG